VLSSVVLSVAVLTTFEQSTPYLCYMPEPKQPRGRRWTDQPTEQQQAVYNHRRRSKRSRLKSYRGSQVNVSNGASHMFVKQVDPGERGCEASTTYSVPLESWTGITTPVKMLEMELRL
jgi:hypothetical protein